MRARWSVEGQRWWWMNESEQMKIDRDVVDVSFKLRSPPKIMFDMNTCQVDKKIKNCIILEVHYKL